MITFTAFSSFISSKFQTLYFPYKLSYYAWATCAQTTVPFRITLAAIISSNRNPRSLSKFYYTFLSPKCFPGRHVTQLCNLDFLKTDFEISRTTSGLTSEANCKFTTFFGVANPLILWAPPQMFIEAEKTRSDFAISPTHFGVTTSNTQNKPTSNKLTNTCRIFSRTSCITYGYFSHLKLPCVEVWRVTRKPVLTLE